MRGKLAPTTEAPILVPNHLVRRTMSRATDSVVTFLSAVCLAVFQSFVEPLFLMCYGGVSHVAKASTATVPVMGALAVAVQQLFVMRTGGGDGDGGGKGLSSSQVCPEAVATSAENHASCCLDLGFSLFTVILRLTLCVLNFGSEM